MFWNRFFWPSMLVLVLLTIFHWIGSLKDLYETVWWFDIPMHFLGGLWVYLFILWSSHTQYGTWLLPYISKKKLLMFVITAGLLWELLELALHFTSFGDERYLSDTPMDLIMDMIGAVVGSKLYKR